MGGWVRCTVKEPFLEGDVIRWTQDIKEKKHPAREELVRVGELEVTAQVQSEDEKGWVFLTVITSIERPSFSFSNRVGSQDVF